MRNTDCAELTVPPADPLWHDRVCRPFEVAWQHGALALIWDATTDSRHGWGMLSGDRHVFVRLSHCPYCGGTLQMMT